MWYGTLHLELHQHAQPQAGHVAAQVLAAAMVAQADIGRSGKQPLVAAGPPQPAAQVAGIGSARACCGGVAAAFSGIVPPATERLAAGWPTAKAAMVALGARLLHQAGQGQALLVPAAPQSQQQQHVPSLRADIGGTI